MTTSLQALHREPVNRSGLKRLRNEGRLPGIIFGVNTDNAMIHISKKEFQKWLKAGGGSVVRLELGDNESIPVLLEDVHRDPVTQELIHADFLRVRSDELVRTKLPIVYTGTAVGTKRGGVVQIDSSFVEVQALPDLIPSSITVDISDLDVSHTIQAGEISLPEGVKLVSSDAEYLVSVTAPRVETVHDSEQE